MIKAAVLRKPFTPLQVQDFPRPHMEEGAILLRTMYSEVCGTDVHLFHGKLPETPYPIIPGHFSVGEVEESAGDVWDVVGHCLIKGDRVVFLDVHETCHSCWYCLVAKETTRCPHRKVYGITYSCRDGLLGGWSEGIYLKPGVKTLRLPPEVPPERFIGGGCGLPTAFHAVARGGVRLGDMVVVQGAGPVGLSSVALASLSGAVQVIVIGAPAMRLRMARQMGADAVIDIETVGSEEWIERVRELTEGRGGRCGDRGVGESQGRSRGHRHGPRRRQVCHRGAVHR